MSYTDPTDGDDASATAIQDATGNDAASFTVEVRNAGSVAKFGADVVNCLCRLERGIG